MTVTFANAATQLSFAEFFERCILSRAIAPRLQPSSTQLQDASTQASPHSVASADATTHLPLTEFFLGRVYSRDSLDRQPTLPSHGNRGIQFSHGEGRLQQRNNRQTTTTYMHTVLMEALVAIMNCFQSLLGIKTQLMLSPANGKPSPEQRQTQKYFCPLLRIQFKPQQLHHLKTSGTCLEVRRHSAWMKRS